MTAAKNYTDWNRVRELAYNGRYLFCSCEKLDDPDGSWLRGFREDAARHGACVDVTGGCVYVVFDS